MKLRASLVVAGLLAAGITVAGASPASAAAPRCTGQGHRQGSTKPAEVIYFPAHSPTTPVYHPGTTYQVGVGFWTCSLVQGSTGPGVKQLQVDMNNCYSAPIGGRLTEDGNFGPRTKAALVKVQQWHSIGDDGQYGPVTSRTMQHSAYNVYIGWQCRTLAEEGYPGDSG